MAYPTVSAPYGLKPVNRIDGMPYAGATRQMGIASGYASNIFYGDMVSVVTGGTVEKFTGTTSGAMVGVFVGCQYTDPSSKQPRWSQYWPTGTVASDAVAYVVDDPMALFQVAVTDGSSVVVDTTTIAAIGANMSVIQGTGDTTTGDSAVSVLAGSEATTATLPIRVIAVVPATKTTTGYPELLVKLNTHQYNSTTGV
jgi:hypothetical protein